MAEWNNKYMHHAMNIYNKHYFERYARLTLYSVFPEWKPHFSIIDRPDLQNELDDVGIEVTSSTPSHIREVASYGAKLLGEKITIENEEKFRGKLFLDSERVAYGYSPTKGLVDADKSPEIIAAISHKCDIWNGYKEFHLRGIYVFTGTSLIDDEMLKNIVKSEASSFFNLVIINAIDTLYYFLKGSWTRIEFSDEELADFKKKALLVEYSCEE